MYLSLAPLIWTLNSGQYLKKGFLFRPEAGAEALRRQRRLFELNLMSSATMAVPTQNAKAIRPIRNDPVTAQTNAATIAAPLMLAAFSKVLALMLTPFSET